MAYNKNKPNNVNYYNLLNSARLDLLEPGQAQSVRRILERFAVGDVQSAGTSRQSAYAYNIDETTSKEELEKALNDPLIDADNSMDATDQFRQYSKQFASQVQENMQQQLQNQQQQQQQQQDGVSAPQ